MRIGAHVSSSGGLDKVIARTRSIGAELCQIFCSSPQSWAFKDLPADQLLSFKQQAVEYDIGPNFLHGIYLLNIGVSDEDKWNKTIQSLVNYLEVASQTGMKGVIFHPGNHAGLGFDKVLDRCAEAISKVLSLSLGSTELIIENSAGMGNSIGSNFSEIGTLIRNINNNRCKVCIDTQHSYASGYDISSREGLKQTLQEFEDHIGFDKLAAIHVNDSKKPLGSGVDRHENLGEGYLGLTTFENLVTHEALKDVPLILEVPGQDRKGPDQANIDILKGFRKAAFN